MLVRITAEEISKKLPMLALYIGSAEELKNKVIKFTECIHGDPEEPWVLIGKTYEEDGYPVHQFDKTKEYGVFE